MCKAQKSHYLWVGKAMVEVKMFRKITQQYFTTCNPQRNAGCLAKLKQSKVLYFLVIMGHREAKQP